MKSNGNLVDLIEKVKPEIRTLIEKCNTVSRKSNSKFWSKLGATDTGSLSDVVLFLSFQAVFCSSVGQNVGSVADPQDRGWQQLWSVHPGGDSSGT